MPHDPISTSGSSWRESLAPKSLVKVALVAGGVCALGYLGYRVLGKKVNNSNRKNSRGASETPAEAKKRQGVELYRRKDYQSAVEKFNAAIDSLETGSGGTKNKDNEEFLATVHNNIAACYDEMGRLDDCINHCTEAIALSPKYWKPINRRARSYHKQQRFREALNDYIGALSPPPNEEQKKTVEVEIERVLSNLVEQDTATLFPALRDKFQPIPQHVVFDWMYSTVVNDPLLERMEKLNAANETNLQGVDRALWKVKNSRFDDVLPDAKKVYEDVGADVKERVQALLLSARFLNFHNQRNQAVAMLNYGHGKLWAELTSLGENCVGKLEMALHTLRVTMAETTQDAEKIVESSPPGNTDALVVLGVLHMQDDAFEEAQRVFKMVLELQPEHPYAKYYDYYSTFQIALRNQIISEVHNAIYQLDQAVQAASQAGGKPPVIALILLAKIYMCTDSTDMALAMSKQILSAVPNCAFAMYTYGILMTAPSTATQQQLANKSQLVASVEKAMQKVVEMDPNYWEPYRMLAIIHRERHQMDKALEYMDKALGLVRKREELAFLLNDRHFIVALKERVESGLPIPTELEEVTEQ